MKRLFYLTTIILAFPALFGCNENESELDELEAMRQRWENLDLKDYSYEAGYNCYCGGTGPYTLEFVDGELDTVYLSDGESSNIDYEAMVEMTENLVIETLFQRIEEHINQNPHSYNIEYNLKYFFPKDAYFDFEKNIIDEELGYYIEDFSFLQ